MAPGMLILLPAFEDPSGYPKVLSPQEGGFSSQVDNLARVQGYAAMWSSTYMAEGWRRLSGRTIPVLPPHSSIGRDLASALLLA